MAQASDTVWLPVLPSMKGFGPAMVKGTSGQAAAAGKVAGAGFGKAMLIGAAGIAAGVGLAGVALYKTGAIFKEVEETIRVGSGASGDALNDMVDIAKNMGTKIPASFEDIGSIIADVNTRMGLSGPTLEKVATQYAEAGRILGEEVDVNKTSKAFSAFKIEGEAVSGAMDHLFQVSQATGVGMNELASTTAENAPAMIALGFSFEDTAGMVGTLDKAGLNSSKTMMGMSKALVELAKDGEDPQKAFARVTEEMQGFVDKGDDAKALDLASDLFGTRNASQFVGALKSGKLNMEDLADVAGMTDDTIIGLGQETMNFGEQWQVFKNKVLVWLEPLAATVFKGMSDAMEIVNQSVTAFGAAWKYNDGDITSSGIPGFMERLGYLAHQLFDYMKDTAIPALQRMGTWLKDNAKAIGIVAGVITALMLPALVRMGVSALVSAAQTAALWLMYRVEAIKAAAVFVAQSALIVVRWVAMGAAAVASGVKTAAVWTGTIIKQAVQGAISFGISVAKIVAGWVLMGVQSLIQAARMAAAWVLAMGPIGWIIIAVVALVALIIANWDKIKTWTVKIFKAVWTFLSDTWRNIKNMVVNFVVGLVTTAINKFIWLRDKVVFWFTAIKNFVVSLWEYLRFRVITFIVTMVTRAVAKFQEFKQKVSDIFTSVKNFFVNIWENGIKPMFQALGDFITKDIPNAFRKGRDAIESIWKKVANIARKPVNFVVNTVYNKGLKTMFNGIADKLGLSWKLPDINPIPAFAKGGPMDRGWKLVGEEGPELINTGPGHVYTANQTKKMLDGRQQMPMEALEQGQQAHKGIGGFWGDVWSGAKSALGGVKDWAVGMIGSAVKGLVSPIKSGLSAALPGGGMNELIRGAGSKLIDDMTGWATSKDDAAAAKQNSVGGGGFAGGYSGSLGSFYRPGGPITSGFGSSRGRYPHAGIDFAVPIGTAVKAMFDGVVKKTGWNAVTGRSGKGLVMAHGSGMGSYYGHLSGWSSKPGDKVKAGQTIARSGNTGRSTGPHLHAELWKNGSPFNYASYLHDQGGVLNPGLSQIVNNTGKPEAILNNKQWSDISRLAMSATVTQQAPSLDGATLTLQMGSEKVLAKVVNRGVHDISRGKKAII